MQLDLLLPIGLKFLIGHVDAPYRKYRGQCDQNDIATKDADLRTHTPRQNWPSSLALAE